MNTITSLKVIIRDLNRWGQLYEEFGHNDTVVALSQYLDNLVAEIQKEKLENLKHGGYYENKRGNSKAI